MKLGRNYVPAQMVGYSYLPTQHSLFYQTCYLL
jgi:hypothetical protein